ncbi:MAG: DUF2007 domain-containing protein [Gammaproteobacteria bacterium]|jgi:hypothetical protein
MSRGDDGLFAGRELVCVHRGTDPIEASLLEGLLQSEGIPATVTGADLVGGYSGVPKVCDVRLLVPARYRESAAEVLERYRRERPAEAEWTCPACGETNAPSFESCWNCGRERGADA